MNRHRPPCFHRKHREENICGREILTRYRDNNNSNNKVALTVINNLRGILIDEQ